MIQICPSSDWRLSLLVSKQRTDSDAKPERNRKKTKGEPLALLDFHSSYRTNSLFLLFNAERISEVVALHIRTSAGRVRLESAGGIRSNGATRRPHSHHASHQDLQKNNTYYIIRVSMSYSSNQSWSQIGALHQCCNYHWELVNGRNEKVNQWLSYSG